MSDWVHCNKCYIQPSGSASRQYHLTNCGHILCSECLTASHQLCNNNKKTLHCYVCSRSNVGVIRISSNMEKKVKQFFVDINQLWIEKMSKISKIHQFQNRQTQSLIRFSKKMNGENAANFTSFNSEFPMAPNLNNSMKSDLTATSYMQNQTSTSMEKFANTVGSLNSSFSYMPNRVPITQIPFQYPTKIGSNSSSSLLSVSHNNSSINNTPQPYRRPPKNIGSVESLKPTILATYNARTQGSSAGRNLNNTTSTSSSSAAMMTGRITKGNVIPRRF